MTVTKLTSTEVNEIRIMGSHTDTTVTSLAQSYGVSRRTIQRILNNESYKTIPSPKNLNTNYLVTNDGRIWSKNTNTFISTRNGKARITTKNGSRVTVDVNDIVESTF